MLDAIGYVALGVLIGQVDEVYGAGRVGDVNSNVTDLAEAVGPLV
jgi:hypothetical protein